MLHGTTWRAATAVQHVRRRAFVAAARNGAFQKEFGTAALFVVEVSTSGRVGGNPHDVPANTYTSARLVPYCTIPGMGDREGAQVRTVVARYSF